MSKHIPGPYTIAEDASKNLFDEVISIDVLDAKGFPVAELPLTAIMPDYMEKLGINHWSMAPGEAFIDRDPNEVLATAHLFAAAPEMYKALQRALQFIINGREFGYIQMPDDNSGDPALMTLDIIRKALSKAEGR